MVRAAILLVVVLIVLAVIQQLWRALGGARLLGAPELRMSFRDGRVTAVDGSAPSAVRGEVADVGRLCGTTGTVTFYGSGRVEFSARIPPADRQRFQNVLAAARQHPRPST